jgi:hypothetical protein
VADTPPDAPRPAAGGGFSLSKRYGPLPAWGWGLVGGVGLYAAYRFYESRQSSSTAASSSSTSSGEAIDYAPQIATLQAEIQQLQGTGSSAVSTTTASTAPATTPSSTAPSSTPSTTGAGKVMPNVVGQRANFAIGELKTGYGIRATTLPVRNSKNEYTVTGQTPKAGAKVVAGMPAVLTVKVIKKGAA